MYVDRHTLLYDPKHDTSEDYIGTGITLYWRRNHRDDFWEWELS